MEHDLVAVHLETVRNETVDAKRTAVDVVDLVARAACEVMMMRELGRLETGSRVWQLNTGEHAIRDGLLNRSVNGRDPDTRIQQHLMDLVH